MTGRNEILLIDPSDTRYFVTTVFLESGGSPCTVDPDLPMPIRELRAKAYATGKPVFRNNIDESEWTKLSPQGHVRMDNVMFAPLILEGKAVGVLGLANKTGGFTDEDIRMAAAFGDQAAIALQNSRNLEERFSQGERYVVVMIKICIQTDNQCCQTNDG